MKPGVFLDRDGVLNYRIPGDTYVTRPEQLEVLPHAAEAVRTLRERGYTIVVITNQRGVARGFMSEQQVAQVHAKLRDVLGAEGAALDGIYYCPHDRDDGCPCRKPRPGMLLQAAEELGLDLTRSVLVGDNVTDLQAAEAAGIPLRIFMESNTDVREVLDRIPDAS